MGLSEEQIGKLLEWFVKMSETRKRLSEQSRRSDPLGRGGRLKKIISGYSQM